MDNDIMKTIFKELEPLPTDGKVMRLYDLIEQESQKPDDQIDMQLIEMCTNHIDLLLAEDSQDLSEKEIDRIYIKHQKQLQATTPKRTRGRSFSPYKRAMTAAAAFILICGATLIAITAARGNALDKPLLSVLQSMFSFGEPTESDTLKEDPYASYFLEGITVEEMYLTKPSGQERLTYYTKGTEEHPYYQAVFHTDGVEYVVACSDYDQLVAYMNDMLP